MFVHSTMTSDMRKYPEIPNCKYTNPPTLITPHHPTPKHSLYLSNLDDQTFFRFAVGVILLYEKAIDVETLKLSLSRVLTKYYPLAGRLRVASNNDEKLEVDCNGEGAVFVEAFIDISCKQFLELCGKPNKSWEKLNYKVEGVGFVDVPPLLVQVTYLNCGGMILGTSISHCLCDGLGTAQFIASWAHMTSNPTLTLPFRPYHNRELLKPRCPLQVNFSHTLFAKNNTENHQTNIHNTLRSQPLETISITFSSYEILHLKKQIFPTFKCSSFEALAAHTWRAWVRSLDLPHLLNTKLIFSVNIRKRLKPEIPQGFYGNGFVSACAQGIVKDLISDNNLFHGVKSLKHANFCVNDEYIRSMVDLLEGKKVNMDLSTTLVITQWNKFGSDHGVDFGTGNPLYWGPTSVGTFCRFCPSSNDPGSIKMLISLPPKVAQKFQFYMTKYLNGGAKL